MKEYKVIIFDLDGTLSDSGIGITKCVQYALKKLNIIEEDLEKLKHYQIGDVNDKFYQEIVKVMNRGEKDESD